MRVVTEEQLTVAGSAEELERFVAAVAGSSCGRPLVFSYEAVLPTPQESRTLRLARHWRASFWGRWHDLDPEEVSLERSEPGRLVYRFRASEEPTYLLLAELTSRFPALTLTLVHSDAAACTASVSLFTRGSLRFREVADGRRPALDLLRRYCPEQVQAWAAATNEPPSAVATTPAEAALPARVVVCSLCGSSELWEDRQERQLVRATVDGHHWIIQTEPLREPKTLYLNYQCSDCGHELTDDDLDAAEQPPQTPALQLV